MKMEAFQASGKRQLSSNNIIVLTFQMFLEGCIEVIQVRKLVTRRNKQNLRAEKQLFYWPNCIFLGFFKAHHEGKRKVRNSIW